jgi:hypothetical protein
MPMPENKKAGIVDPSLNQQAIKLYRLQKLFCVICSISFVTMGFNSYDVKLGQSIQTVNTSS